MTSTLGYIDRYIGNDMTSVVISFLQTDQIMDMVNSVTQIPYHKQFLEDRKNDIIEKFSRGNYDYVDKFDVYAIEKFAKYIKNYSVWLRIFYRRKLKISEKVIAANKNITYRVLITLDISPKIKTTKQIEFYCKYLIMEDEKEALDVLKANPDKYIPHLKTIFEFIDSFDIYNNYQRINLFYSDHLYRKLLKRNLVGPYITVRKAAKDASKMLPFTMQNRFFPYLDMVDRVHG